MINVTKVQLPPLDEYVRYLEGIWQRGHVTNHGPLVVELERQLAAQLEVPHVYVVTNGMLALHIAIRALRLSGSVLTTPFSYVATTAAPVWEGLRPIYADIDAGYCLDPDAARAAWADDTSAILATHVYGNACQIEALQTLASERGAAVIYDAAHAYGARYQGRPLASYGDISILSFHATKLFHTVEGGALITHRADLAQRIEYLRNFGHDGPEHFHDAGTNAKMSEFHAAMGLCMLPRMPATVAGRAAVVALYDELLSGLPLQQPLYREGLQRNYAYYPVVFPDENSLLQARQVLNAENIYPRRYFYPSLSELSYVQAATPPYAGEISRRVLCLPLWESLDGFQVRRIASLIRKVLA